MKTALISGAGIAGPTLAFWLERHGYVPTIVERAPAFRSGGYMIDFWGSGYDVAEKMGLLPILNETGYHIETVRLVGSSGRTVAGFDARVFDAAAGGRFVSLPRGDLASCIDQLIADHVETIFGASITALEQNADGVNVAFDTAPSRRYDIVIGADGLHSKVRQLAFGPEEHYLRPMGYVTAAFHARDYPHRDEGCYVSFSIPGGQVARYALRDGWSAFFFLFKTPGAGAQALREAQAQRAFLEETFHGRGWECDEILRALERADDLYFDEVAQAHVPQWSRGRVALIGDAAYCPSLLAGEGSGMAMAGAYVLAASLARHTQPEHAFAEYENAFRPFAARKQNSAARFASWFAPSSRVGIWVRNIFTMMLNVPGLGVRLANGVLNDDLTLPELRAKSSNPH